MSDATPIAFVADPSRLPAAGPRELAEASGTVVYRSAGACLLIGALDDAIDAIASLPSLSCTIATVVDDATTIDKRLLDTGVAVFAAPTIELVGHLGDFVIEAVAGERRLDLAVATWRESGRFDLVVDLQARPLVTERLPPLGYLHLPPDTDGARRAEALAEFDGLVGEFDKPRYFDWNASLCAHSRSSLEGCSRCIDVCAAGAIVPAGDGVGVDPYRCQGCGTCATVCPSGAMRYAYPPVGEAVRRTRARLADAAQSAGAGGDGPIDTPVDTSIDTVVLHVAADADAVRAATASEAVLDLAVEEVTAFGIDYWASVLAAGVGRIVLVSDAPDDDPGRLALMQQTSLLETLLNALPEVAAAGPVMHVVPVAALADTLAQAPANAALAGAPSAAFEIGTLKRTTLRGALDALSERHPPKAPVTTLPPGAPFGRVAVDTAACTLCMACVSTCPAGALLDGQDRPALRFIEANCVQCGLCEAACPEHAVSLEARYRWDSVEARRTEVLHEEEPFRCVTCHVPFATRGVIDTMMAKLAGHWMFEDPKALRRLKMCEDCRVKDLFTQEPEGPVVHREPRDRPNGDVT